MQVDAQPSRATRMSRPSEIALTSAVAGAYAEEVVAAADPGLVILVGEDAEAVAGQRLRDDEPGGLDALPRFPSHHDVDVYSHSPPPKDLFGVNSVCIGV